MIAGFAHSIPLRARLIPLVVLIGGCQGAPTLNISLEQTHHLNVYVAAYHFCVAHTAARIDDGRTPIGDVAASAMDHCRPEERDIAGFLTAIQTPDGLKVRYLDDLLDSAAKNSALMLKRQRKAEPMTHAI